MQQLETKQKKPRRNAAPRIGFAEPESEEWDHAWAGMADLTGDVDREAHEPMSGEVWQYMGTHNRMHNFRHRSLPSREGQRVYFNVEAMTGDTDPAVATKAATAEAVAS